MTVFKNQELAERIDYYGKEKATKKGTGDLIESILKTTSYVYVRK